MSLVRFLSHKRNPQNRTTTSLQRGAVSPGMLQCGPAANTNHSSPVIGNDYVTARVVLHYVPVSQLLFPR